MTKKRDTGFRYTAEEKQRAIDTYNYSGSILKAARSVGASTHAVQMWVKKFKKSTPGVYNLKPIANGSTCPENSGYEKLTRTTHEYKSASELSEVNRKLADYDRLNSELANLKNWIVQRVVTSSNASII